MAVKSMNQDMTELFSNVPTYLRREITTLKSRLDDIIKNDPPLMLKKGGMLRGAYPLHIGDATFATPKAFCVDCHTKHAKNFTTLSPFIEEDIDFAPYCACCKTPLLFDMNAGWILNNIWDDVPNALEVGSEEIAHVFQAVVMAYELSLQDPSTNILEKTIQWVQKEIDSYQPIHEERVDAVNKPKK